MKLKALTIFIAILLIMACSSDPEYSVKQLAEDDTTFKQAKAFCEDGTYSASGVTCQNLKKATTKRLWRVD